LAVMGAAIPIQQGWTLAGSKDGDNWKSLPIVGLADKTEHQGVFYSRFEIRQLVESEDNFVRHLRLTLPATAPICGIEFYGALVVGPCAQDLLRADAVSPFASPALLPVPSPLSSSNEHAKGVYSSQPAIKATTHSSSKTGAVLAPLVKKRNKKKKEAPTNKVAMPLTPTVPSLPVEEVTEPFVDNAVVLENPRRPQQNNKKSEATKDEVEDGSSTHQLPVMTVGVVDEPTEDRVTMRMPWSPSAGVAASMSKLRLPHHQHIPLTESSEDTNRKRPVPLLIQASEEDVLGALSKLTAMENSPSPSSSILLSGAHSPFTSRPRVSPRVASPTLSLSDRALPLTPRLLGLDQSNAEDSESPQSGLGTPFYPGTAASSPHSRLPAQLEDFLQNTSLESRRAVPAGPDPPCEITAAAPAPVHLEDFDDEEAMLDLLLETLSH